MSESMLDVNVKCYVYIPYGEKFGLEFYLAVWRISTKPPN